MKAVPVSVYATNANADADADKVTRSMTDAS